MTEELIGKLGYLGIALLLVLGGLGLPVPEEAPIVLAAVLSRGGKMWWPLALASCFAGVLLGDFVVYFLGFVYGEKVMSLPLTRKFLSRAREAQIKGYFHRHGFKILILGRFAVGFRTGRLPDGGHPQAAGAEALPDRPVRGVAEHADRLRPRLRLRPPDREQLRPGEALADRGRGSRPARLAALPLLSGPAAGRHSGRAPRARRRRRPAPARRPARPPRRSCPGAAAPSPDEPRPTRPCPSAPNGAAGCRRPGPGDPADGPAGTRPAVQRQARRAAVRSTPPNHDARSAPWRGRSRFRKVVLTRFEGGDTLRAASGRDAFPDRGGH